MNKVVQDGKVAVIINEAYGTPWYNTHFEEDLVFDPYIVSLVQEMSAGKMPFDVYLEHMKTYLTDIGMNDMPVGQFLRDLVVEWVPVGSKFIIQEYDGYEYIVLEKELPWFNV